MAQPLIFISYSHKDEREKEVLLSHLRVLQKTGLIDTWSDDRIRAGEDWQSQIDEAMAKAKVAVLLISANFLTSDFILLQELPTLLERREHEGLSVFPVIARHCAWREIPWLARMNVRPKNGVPVWGAQDSDVDEKLTVIAEEISAVIKADRTTAAATSVQKESLPTIRIDLDQLAYLAERTPKFPDHLLHNQHPAKEDEPFYSMEGFLTATLKADLTVEVFSRQEQNSEKIGNVTQCWTILLSLLVLNSESEGPLKWLIKESVRALREQTINEHSMIHILWEYLCWHHGNHQSPYYRPDFLNAVLSGAIEHAGKSYNSLYRFITFLYRHFETDALAIRRITEQLQRLDDDLGNDATPAFLERLKYLIGTGTAIAMHGIDDIPRFDPKFVTVPARRLCNYDFEAMVYPLTVKDYSSLRGVLPKRLGENPSFPYVFKIVSEQGHNLYNLFASEVLAIVNLCRARERDKEYSWDVPTVCEWLALAGCEGRAFPWGNEPPTQLHANLDFGSPSKLQPVGAHPLGVSERGTYDCCGNVHEIVRLSMDNQAPTDFRLAGGCYQTNARVASCQIFRPFRKKREDNRRNTAVRLIRYRKRDDGKRLSALQAFLSLKGYELH